MCNNKMEITSAKLRVCLCVCVYAFVCTLCVTSAYQYFGKGQLSRGQHIAGKT